MVQNFRIATTLAFLPAALAGLPAHAQGDYPNKPVLLVICFGAGGGLDVVEAGLPAHDGNIRALARDVFSDKVLAFELTSVLLLIALGLIGFVAWKIMSAGSEERPVIIVSEGGIGRPIDEIVLNAALFAARGVEGAGAIVNKVNLDMQPELPRLLERGLARHAIPLLGVLPYRQILSNPTLAIIEDGLQGETIWPGRDMDAIIGRVSVATAA